MEITRHKMIYKKNYKKIKKENNRQIFKIIEEYEEEEEIEEEEEEEEEKEEEKENLRIFGFDFVKNNKNKIKLIINNKKSYLKEFIKINDINGNYIKINMIISKGPFNGMYMFKNCKALESYFINDIKEYLYYEDIHGFNKFEINESLFDYDENISFYI